MKQTAAFLLAVVFIGSTAFKPAFADVQPTISGNWLVDLRTVCAVGGVVLFGAWWIARWMQKVEDRLKSGETRFAMIELMAAKREDMLTDIQMKVHHIASGDIKHSKGKEIE